MIFGGVIRVHPQQKIYSVTHITCPKSTDPITTHLNTEEEDTADPKHFHKAYTKDTTQHTEKHPPPRS